MLKVLSVALLGNLFYVELSSAQVNGFPFSREQKIEHTFAFGLDMNTSRGNSDVNGDYKAIAHYMRAQNWLLGLRGELITPQAQKASQMRDTPLGQLIVGYERGNQAFYGSIGTSKSFMPSLAYGVIDGLHHITGLPKPRHSPLSTAPALTASLDMRQEYSFANKNCLGLCLSLHGVGFASLSNLETSVGAGAFLALALKKTNASVDFKPNLPHLPAQAVKESFIYAGLRAKYVGLDATYSQFPFNRTRTELAAGVTHSFKNFHYGVDYSKGLTAEAKGTSHLPVSKLLLRTSFTF
jgi:Uncharacterized protein conserved in bacteria (DUF2219)